LNRNCLPAAVLLALLAPCASAADLTTPWEAMGGNRTPRYDETVAYCRTLADAFPDQVRFTDFGTSPEGRALPLLVVDRGGRVQPAGRGGGDDGRTVLLVQACIHAGESCGKDAGLVLLRDLLQDGGLPADLTILFIPIFNVDGHERFSPYSRVNQNGPEQMGWRATARNLNLNRDYVKADTVEMRAWLALWNRWRPDFLVDIHSTDGADYQYTVTIGLDRESLDPGLADWAEGYLDALETGMAADGWPLAPYISFRKWHDPRSGLKSWVAGPRFSQGYAAVRNRPGLLVETHMLKPYPERVRSTIALLERTVGYLQDQNATLRRLVREADGRTASAAFRAEPLALDWQMTGEAEPFTFLGVAYEEVASELSGGRYFRYHADRPETFTVDYYRQQEPSVSVRLPEAYLVPPAWADVVDRLEWHGVEVRRLAEPVELEVRSCRFTDVTWREQPYEGHHPLTFATEEIREARRFPAGTAVVDLAQPAARLIAHWLAPEGPDSAVRWDFFDAIFSRVEYVESYVIEAMMREMVAAQPALRDSLAAAMASDSTLAGDPWAIRNWFYERTPYFDDRVNVYPVGWLSDRDRLATLPVQ